MSYIHTQGHSADTDKVSVDDCPDSYSKSDKGNQIQVIKNELSYLYL